MSDRSEKHIQCPNCSDIEVEEWNKLYTEIITRPRQNDIIWLCDRCSFVLLSQNPKNHLYYKAWDGPRYIRNGNHTVYKLI